MPLLRHIVWKTRRRFAVAECAVVRAWVALALLAVLLTQSLGLVHGIVHLQHSDLHASFQGDTASSNHPHHEEQSNGGASWARLFGDHAADADCRLYDQFSHSDTLPGVPFLVLPVTWATNYCHPVCAAPKAASRHPRCQSRAPPLS
jgi:hypothetical protein